MPALPAEERDELILQGEELDEEGNALPYAEPT
jgi:hypothetical protein